MEVIQQFYKYLFPVILRLSLLFTIFFLFGVITRYQKKAKITFLTSLLKYHFWLTHKSALRVPYKIKLICRILSSILSCKTTKHTLYKSISIIKLHFSFWKSFLQFHRSYSSINDSVTKNSLFPQACLSFSIRLINIAKQLVCFTFRSVKPMIYKLVYKIEKCRPPFL